MADKFLVEARRLYDMGCACHWIKPNSKAPVKAGWSGGARDPWPTVEKDYRPGYGLGLRLGAPSHVEGGYLANIDVDIKSGEPRHKAEALKLLDAKFPGLRGQAPLVKTGHGLRYFVRTVEPIQSGKLGASNEETIVRLPTSEVNRRQQAAVDEGKITAKQLADGFRLRPAWELEFMSAGKQVVLPPSIHPETKTPYIWSRPLAVVGAIPIVAPDGLGAARLSKAASSPPFEPVAVDFMDPRFSDRLVDMILNGTGITDRSAALFGVCRDMHNAGFTDVEILSALTEPGAFLAEAAYERRGQNRASAAAWVREYTLVPVLAKASAESAFLGEVVVAEELDEAAAEAQVVELVGETNWKDRLARTDKGAIRPTLQNIVLILTGVYGPEIFREDLFSGFRVYGAEAPWGRRIGDEFTDRERPLMVQWFSENWGCEPPNQIIFDAVAVIAARAAFHPIRDYLEGLKWDGVARVDTWLVDYMNATAEGELYLREVSRKVLVAMVTRALVPGCKFDHMLILKGKQGVRKSSALCALAGGDKYFSSTELQAGQKDTILKMASKWVVEFGELSALKADVKALKNFLTTGTDRDRLPFDRLAQDFPRKCIFVGTTNEDVFLHDETGNRRYWPVQVGAIDVEGITAARDQLFAEAYEFYALGEPIYLTREAESEAKFEQERWTPNEDVIVERVRLELERNKLRAKDALDRFPVEGFSLSEIMERLNCRDDMATQRRVGHALKANKYEKRVSRAAGALKKLWFPII